MILKNAGQGLVVILRILSKKNGKTKNNEIKLVIFAAFPTMPN